MNCGGNARASGPWREELPGRAAEPGRGAPPVARSRGDGGRAVADLRVARGSGAGWGAEEYTGGWWELGGVEDPQESNFRGLVLGCIVADPKLLNVRQKFA